MFEAMALAAVLTAVPADAGTVPAVTSRASAPQMTGVRPSEYRGKFFTKKGERFRKCVIRRESNGHYFSRNRSGHAGAYQFNDAAWRVSLTYMIRPELRALIGTRAADVAIERLRLHPVNRWSRWVQDMAFHTALNFEGPMSGWRHWYLAGSKCNGLAR